MTGIKFHNAQCLCFNFKTGENILFICYIIFWWRIQGLDGGGGEGEVLLLHVRGFLTITPIEGEKVFLLKLASKFETYQGPRLHLLCSKFWNISMAVNCKVCMNCTTVRGVWIQNCRSFSHNLQVSRRVLMRVYTSFIAIYLIWIFEYQIDF